MKRWPYFELFWEFCWRPSWSFVFASSSRSSTYFVVDGLFETQRLLSHVIYELRAPMLFQFFSVLVFFSSDEGTLPLRLLLPNVDETFRTVCLHCRFGSVQEQQVLLSIQVFLAACFTLGIQTKLTSVVSWYLYFSLTLRNTWLNYILEYVFPPSNSSDELSCWAEHF